MPLVKGTRSTLNPDAPVYIPAVYRQVDDFSPEWWQLITISTLFREYWLSHHQGDYGWVDDAESDVAVFLPHTLDVEPANDFSSLEAQFEGFVQLSEAQERDEPTA